MKEFGNIVTDLPYKESPSYVENLVDNCVAIAAATETEQKIVRPWFFGLATVAAAAAVAIGVFLFSQKTSPMDSFLASLTDEEAAMIMDWPVTDIPEYYY